MGEEAAADVGILRSIVGWSELLGAFFTEELLTRQTRPRRRGHWFERPKFLKPFYRLQLFQSLEGLKLLEGLKRASTCFLREQCNIPIVISNHPVLESAEVRARKRIDGVLTDIRNRTTRKGIDVLSIIGIGDGCSISVIEVNTHRILQKRLTREISDRYYGECQITVARRSGPVERLVRRKKRARLPGRAGLSGTVCLIASELLRVVRDVHRQPQALPKPVGKRRN